MSGEKNFYVDTSEIDKFIKKLDSAGKKEFKSQLSMWLEAMGIEFLDVLQDEIIRKQVVDTRLLLNSFEKGSKNGVWRLKDGGLTLEIGTNVKYAKYVNDGHWTNPRGVKSRFVPGVWKNGKFHYQKGAKTGMIIKQKFIQGRHYWDSALVIFEKLFNKSLERKVQDWINQYF